MRALGSQAATWHSKRMTSRAAFNFATFRSRSCLRESTRSMYRWGEGGFVGDCSTAARGDSAALKVGDHKANRIDDLRLSKLGATLMAIRPINIRRGVRPELYSNAGGLAWHLTAL